MAEVYGIFLDYILQISGVLRNIHDIIETILSIGIFLIVGAMKKWLTVHKERIKVSIRKFVVLIVIWMSICQGLTVTVLICARSYVANEQLKLVFEFISIVSFIGIIAIVAFVIYIQITNEKMQQLLVTERELKKMQEQYYTVLLERENDTKNYRHDMNNHLLCLYELASDEKIREIQDYIGKMKENFSEIQRKCYVTGNGIMDILLNYHLTDLPDTEITVTGKCIDKPAVTDVEFCTIFSNVIQNAVEEIHRQNGNKKYIKVKVQQGKQYLSIIVKNSSKLIWNETDKKLSTSKVDKKNHGIGLENVRETVKKNGGRFELSGDGKEVTATIILPYN